MTTAFASQADLAPKTETFAELAPGVFALTAEGDPNSGVVVGDESVLVIDARATPVMARELAARVREVTDKPIRHVLLTHYHAVRVLGASGFADRVDVIASEATRAMIVERGREDMESEIQRFPRLFRARETVPGLTWPTLTFDGRITLRLGRRTVEILHAGRGHTAGDTVAWLPEERILFAGDLVEAGATPYCGDAHFGDWPGTLERVAGFGARALVPGRGEALVGADRVENGIGETRAYLRDLYGVAKEGVAAGHGLKEIYATALRELRPRYGHWVIFEHCMPFNVSRAVDEAGGLDRPRIWTAERDIEMWRALEGAAAG